MSGVIALFKDRQHQPAVTDKTQATDGPQILLTSLKVSPHVILLSTFHVAH